MPYSKGERTTPVVSHSPIAPITWRSPARVKLLRKPNVRRVTIGETTLIELLDAVDLSLGPILLMAYDTGMREGEILNLRWSQIDLKAGVVRLGTEDTKTNKARTVYLTARVTEAVRRLPRQLHSDFVFLSQRTGSKWSERRPPA